MSIEKEFVDVIKSAGKKETKPYDTQATVTRVEGQTVWVHIPGGVDETPIKRTVNAKEGDIVQVRVSGGSAWLMGNASSPPTDDTQALLATEYARSAGAAAESAIASAKVANDAATNAKAQASNATTYASEAKTQAISAADSARVAGIAASVAQAAADAAQNDIDEQKEWFWHDANGSHILGADSGYRNDITSTGMNIVDTSREVVVSSFGVDEAYIGEKGKNNVTITGSRIALNNNGIEVAYLSGERLNSPDIVATNIFMQTTNAATRERIGKVGWVMRSNGHLSLRRMI